MEVENNNLSGQRYLGILAPDNTITNLGLISDTNAISWNAITFDCDDNLIGVDAVQGDLYYIDENELASIGAFVLLSAASPPRACGAPLVVGCDEKIAYNWDDNTIYRFSDLGDINVDSTERALITYAGPNFDTGVAVTLTPSVTNPPPCPDTATIMSLEYIGNDLFVAGCSDDSTKEAYVLIDVSGDTFPVVISDFDGSTTTTNGPVDLNALGVNAPDAIIPFTSSTDVCTAVCSTANPTSNPTINPTTANPTANPVTASPTVFPTSNPTVNPTANPIATGNPTVNPTVNPTTNPITPATNSPTGNPTAIPTVNPTANP